MNKLRIIFLSFFIFLNYSLYSQSYRQVNYEGAGWVTAVKYSSDGTRLYARTDVGGVYKSDNGGNDWQYISNYAVTISGLHVQGLAIHPTNKNIVYIACGVSYRDTDPGRGVWKTTDGGNSWAQVLASVNFSGNDDIRWGGECICIDPQNPEIVYAGGRESGIYKTINGGGSWTNVATAGTVSGNISSITIRPGTTGSTAELWAGSQASNGSNAGVWRSVNGGSSWTQMRTSAQVEGVAFRILVKTDGTAFVAYNENLMKYTAGTWTTFNVFTSGQGNLCAVHFMGSENKIVASRMDYTRVSTDGGQTFPTVLPMTMLPPLPKHSFDWTTVNWARNHFAQNPVNANEWYISGGFGCIKSTDGGQNWKYATNGINIPVMYKTYFNLSSANYVYLPMGDLTMGRLTDGGVSGNVSDYAFYSFSILQDFSNATVVMTTAANNNKQYIAGGNVYAGETPGVFMTTNNGANFTRMAGNGLPNTQERPIVGGVASDNNANKLIVYIGGDYSNIGTTGGVYWSEDGGANFTRASGLAQNIMAPGVYYTYYGLAKDPSNNLKRYGYFEGDGGGFYESNDEGKNWSLKNNILPGYKPSGTLCVHPSTANLFYIAAQDAGLFKTTDGGTTWNNMPGWVSAEQVDSRGNIIAVFGKRTGDTYSKNYRSNNNGASWGVVNTYPYALPNTTSLTINPYNQNQLWIGTSGNGTFIYDGLNVGVENISSETPKDFKLSQNYPNPFNPSTNIEFSVASAGLVNIEVYDVTGKSIESIVNENLKAGTYKLTWNAANYPSGVYYYTIEVNGFSETKKMMLIK